MLSERNLQLLTAFVDGELTRRQRKLVMRLLNRSSQARSVLQELQEGAHRVRALPRRQLNDALAGQVLRAIADRGLRVDSPHTDARRLRRWLGYAAAACVLLALGFGIFLANRPWSSDNSTNIAKVNPATEPAAPLRVTFKELAEKPKQELLAHRLQTQSAVHLDLTVRDNVKAVREVRHALEGQGIKTIVGARARAKLAKGAQAQATYFVYAENIDAKELTALLRQLAAKPNDKSAPASTFESMVVTNLNADDRQNLSGLFGSKPSAFEAPVGTGDLFENAPIQAPKGNGAVPAPRQAGRFAMILASVDGMGPTDEAKAFLAGRSRRHPGTLQVLLVIRQA